MWQIQIQALNAALPALGLTIAEIQLIDRIASLAHNFNPAAYANLVNQFEAPPSRRRNQAPRLRLERNTNAPINAGQMRTAPFQVREILIHLTGVQGRK